jgi:hypothetical protein
MKIRAIEKGKSCLKFWAGKLGRGQIGVIEGEHMFKIIHESQAGFNEQRGGGKLEA